jgi:hypothetical protein
MRREARCAMRHRLLLLLLAFGAIPGCVGTDTSPENPKDDTGHEDDDDDDVPPLAPPSSAPDPVTRNIALPPIQSRGSVVLRAVKVYASGEAQDAEGQRSAEVPFSIPASLPVRLGAAGDGTVELSFRAPSGEATRCEYRGEGAASGVERRYVFATCDRGQRAGEAASGIWFKLHVAGGDALDPAGLTLVEAALGGALDELEPPISPGETARLLDSFAWQATAPLAEYDPAGLPSLYYALAYVESREQLAALDGLAIHYSALPLFNEELERWRGKRGLFGHEGDGRGVFVFTLVPGAIFNLLRSFALLGNVVVPAIVLREPPAAARAADGSVSYEALRSSDFVYRGYQTAEEERAPSDEPPAEAPWAPLADAARRAADEVIEGIGPGGRAEHGTSRLALRLDLRNADPAFGVGTSMVRASSDEVGKPLPLNGVRVTLHQRPLGALLASSRSAKTSDTDDETALPAFNQAALPLGLGRDFAFCVSVANGAARVTRGTLPVEVCDFSGSFTNDAGWNVVHVLPIAHPYFNLLALFNEGRDFLSNYADTELAPAEVLVGPLADLAGSAQAPCLAASGTSPQAFASALAEGLTGKGAVGAASAARVLALQNAYGVDLVVPSAPADEGIDANLDTRGFATREYGHFALCSMLYQQAPADFATLYGELALDRARTPDAPSPDGGPTYEARVVDEVFANVFSVQLGGGVAYFDPNDSAGPFDRFGLHYCEAENGACLEADRRSTATFADQVARATTLLHDAFDAGKQSYGTENGNVWSLDPTTGWLVYDDAKQARLDDDDDPFNLSPWSFPGLVSKLIARRVAGGPALTHDGLMGAVSDLLSEGEVGYGHDWCSRCRLFAAYDANWGPDQPLTDICTVAPTSNWLGTAEASSVITVKLGPDDPGAIVRSGADVRDTNFADTPFFGAAAWSVEPTGVEVYRSYFAFDLSPLQGRNVLEAELLLFENTNDIVFDDRSGHSTLGGPNAAYLRRVVGPWQASTITWNAQPPADTALASELPSSDDLDTFGEHRVDVSAAVRAMSTQPETNYGFCLQLQDETTPDRALAFFSGAEPTPQESAPQLRVTVEGCP